MAHPFDTFQRVYIINLASRADRRAEMAEQLRAIGLAIDSPRVSLFTAVRPDDAGDFPSIGARGCFMSHLGVLRDAQSAGLERILILEDDLNFAADFNARAPEVMNALTREDWAMFYGGYQLHGDAPGGEGCVEIMPATLVQTTHFVGLRAPAIGAAVAYLDAMLGRGPGDPRGGAMHVDGAYGWFRRDHPSLRTFIAQPDLGYQRASRTDVHGLRWIDRMPVLRSLVAWLRRARNRRVARAAQR